MEKTKKKRNRERKKEKNKIKYALIQNLIEFAMLHAAAVAKCKQREHTLKRVNADQITSFENFRCQAFKTSAAFSGDHPI